MARRDQRSLSEITKKCLFHRSLIFYESLGCYWVKVFQKVESTAHVQVSIIPCRNMKTTEKIWLRWLWLSAVHVSGLLSNTADQDDLSDDYYRPISVIEDDLRPCSGWWYTLALSPRRGLNSNACCSKEKADHLTSFGLNAPQTCGVLLNVALSNTEYLASDRSWTQWTQPCWRSCMCTFLTFFVRLQGFTFIMKWIFTCRRGEPLAYSVSSLQVVQCASLCIVSALLNKTSLITLLNSLQYLYIAPLVQFQNLVTLHINTFESDILVCWIMVFKLFTLFRTSVYLSGVHLCFTSNLLGLVQLKFGGFASFVWFFWTGWKLSFELWWGLNNRTRTTWKGGSELQVDCLGSESKTDEPQDFTRADMLL